jgi:hypothetical protein
MQSCGYNPHDCIILTGEAKFKHAKRVLKNVLKRPTPQRIIGHAKQRRLKFWWYFFV